MHFTPTLPPTLLVGDEQMNPYRLSGMNERYSEAWSWNPVSVSLAFHPQAAEHVSAF